MSSNYIYLDYAASTPIDLRVVEVMAPYHGVANPSSAHAAGRDVAERVEMSRRLVAGLIGGSPGEVVFTSGATEANNLAIGGVCRAHRGGHIITAVTEHKAVLETVYAHCPVATVVPVDSDGRVDPEDVARAMRPDTILVSVMAANNEIGTIGDIAAIGEICKSREVLFHSDVAQAVGKTPIDVKSIAADLVSISAHKIYGPKGVGALWISRYARDQISPILFGGGHERGLRPGTLNVAGCVGFGEAARIAGERLEADFAVTSKCRAALIDRLLDAFPDAQFNGNVDNAVPGIVSVRIPGIDAESLLLATPSVAASTGSACTSATPSPSHVLLALGHSHESASECLRLSFGRFTTLDDIDAAVAALSSSVLPLRDDVLVGP